MSYDTSRINVTLYDDRGLPAPGRYTFRLTPTAASAPLPDTLVVRYGAGVDGLGDGVLMLHDARAIPEWADWSTGPIEAEFHDGRLVYLGAPRERGTCFVTTAGPDQPLVRP